MYTASRYIDEIGLFANAGYLIGFTGTTIRECTYTSRLGSTEKSADYLPSRL